VREAAMEQTMWLMFSVRCRSAGTSPLGAVVKLPELVLLRAERQSPTAPTTVPVAAARQLARASHWQLADHGGSVTSTGEPADDGAASRR
jgi:hypothetical protein